MEETKKVSRRNFLKKLGLGTITLGALTLNPVSALNIKDSNGLQVFDGTGTKTQALDINPGGPVEVKNTYLNMNNHKITGLTNPSNAQDAATKNYVDNNSGSGAEEALAYDFVL